MSRVPMRILILSLGLAACAGADDPLSRVDEDYTRIMVNLGTAERDTARNVRNREARRRFSQAEEARVSFFQRPKVRKAIEAGLAFPDDSVVRAKAERYARELALLEAWTKRAKEEETRLLSRLEQARAEDATWSSADGKVTVSLATDWSEASKPADALDPAERADLAREYAETRMSVVGPDLQELVRLRNKVAREAGRTNYWELALASRGLTQAEIDEAVGKLTKILEPHLAAERALLERTAEDAGVPLDFANLPYLRRRAGLDRGREEADQLFDADLAEERVMTAFQDMGIPTDGWQVHSGPRRYVRPGVYGFPIRPPDAVAIVMSQDRRWSLWQYEALAHEGGHAVWWKFLTPEQAASPVLWSPDDHWFEGFAQFFERLVYDPEFTARYVGELTEAQREALHTWRRHKVTDWIVDAIVQTRTEQRLYEDPNNLEALTRFAAETRSRLTGMPAPAPGESGLTYDPALLSSIVWVYPGYSPSYLFAYPTEAWLEDAIRSQVGAPIGNPRVGPLIRDRIVRQPVQVPFPDRLRALLDQDAWASLSAYLDAPLDPPAEGDSAR